MGVLNKGTRDCTTANLETLAKLDKISHTLVHFALDEGLSLAGEAFLLVCDKVSECWEGIRRLPSREMKNVYCNTTVKQTFVGAGEGALEDKGDWV